ncbi:MAG: SAM-dependent methyltransferase [Bacilli bacterium]|nr:SAM-dependent methyltransferase [Bacilli bacterium]
MNNNINISNRLKTIGDFVKDNSKVIDVGCDHGLLSIYIYLNKKNVRIIASDINEKPLNEARKNLKKYNLENKIELRLSNGIKNYKSNEFDTIIISGLGGVTISNIILEDKSKLENTKNIIIQSNNNIPMIRKVITSLNYKIVNEKLVKENNIIYTIIVFEKSDKKIKCSNVDLLIGPILKNNNDKLLNEYLCQELKKRKSILSKIPRKYLFKRLKIKKEINLYHKLLK